MTSSKIIFAVLVAIIAAAITAAVMMEPGSVDDAGPTEAQPAAGASSVKPGGPRANVQQADKPIGLSVGNRAPSWTANDADGRTHRLEDYLGQVVVMDFWATWCGPCKKVMPDLQAVHEQYESRGVKVLGMNGAERFGGDPVKFMADNEYNYGLLVNCDQIMGRYGAQAIPTIYVIGVDGTILYKHTGALPNLDEELKKIIEPHLERHGL